MRYSIIIPHYHKGSNSTWLLDNALASLAAQEPDLLTHTLVIDDASPAENKNNDLNQLRKKYGFVLIWKRQNTGYSAVVNLGLKLSRKHGYEAAITLNNDVEIQTPLTRVCDQDFASDPLLDVIGALLYFPNGKVQHMGYTVRGVQTPIDHHGAGMPDATHPRSYVFGVTGACQVIRLGRNERKYDERYPLGYEDVAYCYDTWMSGRRVFYDPQLIGIHHESATRGYGMGERETRSRILHLQDVKKWELKKVYQRVAEANDWLQSER
jgi:GT2 family glycosyltransferase